MITIKDVMRMFQDFSLLAGEKAADKELTSVTVIDAPDIGTYIKGGEFVLSTGYAFRNDMNLLIQQVEQMSRSGACAFGIKLDRYIKELPEELVSYAEENQFPIIYIPNNYPFVDVITPLQQILNRREFSSLQYSEYIHNLFLELLMKGVTVNEILNEVERLTKFQTALYQYHNDTISFSGKAEKLKNQVKEMEEGKSLLSVTRELPFFELRLGATVFGRLLFPKGTSYQGEEKIQNRARLYHWDFGAGGLVVIVDVDDYKLLYNKDYNMDISRIQEEQRQLIFAVAKRIMMKYFTQVVYSYLSDQIVFILSETDYEKDKLLNQVMKAGDEIRGIVSENTDFTVMVGIGTYQPQIVQIHESFSQARKSVLIGRAVYKRDRTMAFELLGVYQLLWAARETKEAEELQNAYIGKLLRYDEKNHTELVQTVESLSQWEWNLLKASKESFIHYNTMKYRFAKICEILGVNLRLGEEQTNMDLSLKLYYLSAERSVTK